MWGFLTLILGCLLSIVQSFALLSPRRLDLRIFFLLAGLAIYLIYIGRRSIRLARKIEARPPGVTLELEIKGLWERCAQHATLLAVRIAQPGPSRTVFLTVLGLLHVIASLAVLLCTGGFIILLGLYLGLGNRGIASDQLSAGGRVRNWHDCPA